jgi:hypothetical protein
MDERGSVWKHLLITVISVAGAMVIVWAELPPDQRAWTVLEGRARLHRCLQSAAARAGRAGMANELAAHDPTARAGYGLAYQLSRLRDRFDGRV